MNNIHQIGGFVKPPAVLLARGLAECAARPLVADEKKGRAYRVFGDEAWDRPFIHSFPSNSLPALITDNDDPDRLGEAIYLQDVPPPSYILTNPETGHKQAGWYLLKPVHYNEKSKAWPIDRYGAALDSLNRLTGGDPNFNPRGRHRSPLHEGHEVWFGDTRGYMLDAFPVPRALPRVSETTANGVAINEGRNSALFIHACRWAQKNFDAPVRPFVVSMNNSLSNPLPVKEVDSISRSVEKYRATGWTRRTHNLNPDKQRERGLLSGIARRAATRDRDLQIVADVAGGMTHAQAAEKHGLSRMGVSKIISRMKINA